MDFKIGERVMLVNGRQDVSWRGDLLHRIGIIKHIRRAAGGTWYVVDLEVGDWTGLVGIKPEIAKSIANTALAKEIYEGKIHKEEKDILWVSLE